MPLIFSLQVTVLLFYWFLYEIHSHQAFGELYCELYWKLGRPWQIPLCPLQPSTIFLALPASLLSPPLPRLWKNKHISLLVLFGAQPDPLGSHLPSIHQGVFFPQTVCANYKYKSILLILLHDWRLLFSIPTKYFAQRHAPVLWP